MRTGLELSRSFYFLVRNVCKKMSKLGKVNSGGLCIRGKQVELVITVLVLRSVQVLNVKCEL